MIRFSCPRCQAAYEYSDEMAGVKIRCSAGTCNQKLLIPRPIAPEDRTMAAKLSPYEDESGSRSSVGSKSGLIWIGAGVAALTLVSLVVIVLLTRGRTGKTADTGLAKTAASESKPAETIPAKKETKSAVIPPVPASDRTMPQRIFSKNARSVTLVSVDKSRPNPKTGKMEMVAGSGSGFLLADGIVVTNHHVVSGRVSDRRVRVFFPSMEGTESAREYVPLRIIEDAGRDLAVLFLDRPKAPSVQLAEKGPEPGEEVVAIGSPDTGSGGLSVNDVAAGIIRNPNYIDEKQKLPFYLMTIPIYHGSSGGPVFNGDGKVVGVVVQISLDDGIRPGAVISNMNKAIPLEAVKKFVAEARKRK